MNDHRIHTGDGWEKIATALIGQRHGPLNIQTIPAATQGDAGLDAVCRSEGIVYQFYSVQSVHGFYEGQRDKLTRDINKFINNKDKIKNLLGECKIKRWVLMAPVCNDRRLI
ncbi:MAG: hypothetical protein HQL83_16945 [Magnetococcales bacterium]|nr:hypothetical protein [Magnetococcales bacterium]